MVKRFKINQVWWRRGYVTGISVITIVLLVWCPIMYFFFYLDFLGSFRPKAPLTAGSLYTAMNHFTAGTPKDFWIPYFDWNTPAHTSSIFQTKRFFLDQTCASSPF